MKLPYRITNAASVLYHSGVNFYHTGTTRTGQVAMFDFYQCDKVTPEQMEKIRAFCPDVQVQGVRHRYAPELSAVHVLFPKSAFYARRGTE